jgi:hypothetical protein
MRCSASLTLWRRHSFLMNPIITSHLTKWTKLGPTLERWDGQSAVTVRARDQSGSHVSMVPPDARDCHLAARADSRNSTRTWRAPCTAALDHHRRCPFTCALLRRTASTATPRLSGRTGRRDQGVTPDRFSPTTPASIRPIDASLSTELDSPNAMMPIKAVPAAPIPVQTA